MAARARTKREAAGEEQQQQQPQIPPPADAGCGMTPLRRGSAGFETPGACYSGSFTSLAYFLAAVTTSVIGTTRGELPASEAAIETLLL